MALTALMRRMKVDAVPHGFRSTFRDWCSERTNYPRELAEQALAHAMENKVEAAYRRGDALEKRMAMMQAWADFCAPIHQTHCFPFFQRLERNRQALRRIMQGNKATGPVIATTGPV
jgi:hypothetical protein